MDEETELRNCHLIEIGRYTNKFKSRLSDNKNTLNDINKYKDLANLNIQLNESYNNSKYNAIINDNGILYPIGSDFGSDFTFTHPIIHINENKEITVHKFKKGDKLYVWQTLTPEGIPAHLAAVIVSQDDQKHYGLGYAYSSREEVLTDMKPNFISTSTDKKSGVIYTPDHLFESALLRQVTNPKNKFIKLISLIELTEEHASNINEVFSKFDYSNILYTKLAITPIKHSCKADRTYGFLKELTEELVEKNSFPNGDIVNKQISQFKKGGKLTGVCGFIHNIRYAIRNDSQYCILSSKYTKTYNCASFLYHIFGDSIDCGKILENVYIHPKTCKRGKIPQASCKKSKNTKTPSEQSERFYTPSDGSHIKLNNYKNSSNSERFYTPNNRNMIQKSESNALRKSINNSSNKLKNGLINVTRNSIKRLKSIKSGRRIDKMQLLNSI